MLYIGVTNSLERRLKEHYLNKNTLPTFAGKYHCHHLVYYERYTLVKIAIKREKQLKGWSRKKKEDLIKLENPLFKFLNRSVMDWPPK